MSTMLIISSQAPYYSSAAQDAIEAALAASNVGVEVSFILIDDGVFQLLNDQHGAYIHKKSIMKQIKALPLYDIESIFYVSESLAERKLPIHLISSTATAISQNDFKHICASSTSILRF